MKSGIIYFSNTIVIHFHFGRGSRMDKVRKDDLTVGSLWKKILLFALPLAATSVLQQLFNAADLAVVGSFTGEAGEICMAAVGATTAIVSLIVNAFVGLSIGTNVVIANAIGKKDGRSVSRAVHTSVLFSVLVGFGIILIGSIFAGKLLEMTDVPPDDVLPLSERYLRIYFAGAPLILLYNFEAAIFRAKGDTRTPLAVLAVAGVVNVLLNLFFVVVLKMTVEGVAVATITSNAIGAVVLFIILLRADDDTKISFKGIRIYKDELIGILKIGVPSAIQSSVFSTANIVMQTAINSLDKTVMAASSAAVSIETFAYFMFSGFSQACVTFVGQNRGAGKLDRCTKAMWVSLTEACIALASSILVLLLAGKPMLSLFNPNREVIDIAYQRVAFIITHAYIFSVIYEVLGSYLRGMGISVLPAVITVFGVCGTRITWIMTAFRSNPTFDTVLRAFPLSLGITAVLMVLAVVFTRMKMNKRLSAATQNKKEITE